MKKHILIMALGFLTYPLLFVPIFYKSASDDVFNWYISFYADYLRLWGL